VTAARVRTGPGFAHDVLYGDGPSKEIAQIGGAAEEVGLTLKGIREGDGFAHDVLFGGDKADTGDALKNMNQITADLRDIVRDMKNGKGTIGALLVDPSIYEDVKRLLGNVERNSVLRALVRHSIKQGDKKPSVEISASKE
jgi:phospholipid/cholesterol/gamma-HCH transport system substrate-binding protein